MTAEAQHFVGATTFRALSNNPVYTDLWEAVDLKDPNHIRLARRDLQEYLGRSGITRPVRPHLFRHQTLTYLTT